MDSSQFPRFISSFVNLAKCMPASFYMTSQPFVLGPITKQLSVIQSFLKKILMFIQAIMFDHES